MKYFLILIFFALTQLHADARPLYEKLDEKKYHFSALQSFLRETAQKKISSSHLEIFEKLVKLTGPQIVEDYAFSTLELYNTPASYFIQGKKALAAGETARPLELFRKIPQGHDYYPEAKLLSASVMAASGDFKSENDALNACSNAARKKMKNDNAYFMMVHEICLTNKARRLFKEGKLKEALDEYNRFPKNTYKWPYLLFERAWLYYHLGDYNRALGLLVTYKSPLLDTYFFPEAEYLSALSYYKLCLYQDSTLIINQYYQTYRPRFTALEKVLRENKDKKHFFYRLMFKQDKELKEHADFVRLIVGRIKRQNRFMEGFSEIKLIGEEIRKISEKEKKEVQTLLLPHLKAVRSNLVSKLDNDAKLEFFTFLESVKFFSNELFKMNLQIMEKKKNLIYDNKKLISDRSRGDYSNVKRSRFEYFWKFEGAFWADELGDYSLGLKSNCETVSREAK